MAAQLTPYIESKDARAQAEFYMHALGGEVRFLMTHGQVPGVPEAMKDKVMHMAIGIAGENALFLSDEFVPTEGKGGRGSLTLSLTFPSEAAAREAYANLGEGGRDVYPFELQPWGGHYGEVEDKFGIYWKITKQ
ncbi:VOC family protein [Cohnella zeiphila]|uniref:VOC family protein n=1 Tax=Cohnella zeiphila TaxID=2761120 RepID=A0A7X0VYM3_9BACL|nr:VOC family protein [Cohnella zeiphila]MBB6735156.1 VOC family protein [Cohnella zeiphila]